MFDFQPNKSKKIIVLILFIISISMLIYNFVSAKKIQKKQEKHSAGFITYQFKKVLDNYELNDDWIVQNDILINDDSVSNYVVRLPIDLPVPLIIQEISNSLEDSTIKLAVTEEGINGNSILKVTYSDNLKLKAKFVYDKNLFRDSDTLSFLLTNPEDISKKEFSDLLFSSESYSFLIVPSLSSVSVAKKISDLKKEFCILLNDDISEIQFRLDKNFSKDRLDIPIKEILSKFSNASFYFVDENSSLYQSASFKYVEEEFKKRNISIIKLSSLYNIQSNKSDAVKEFQQKVNTFAKNKKYSFLISTQNYLYLTDYIKDLKKKGYRFVLFKN